MRLLIDTHLLIWLAAESPRLGERARHLIADAESRWFSVASLWEIAIKHALGKPGLPFDPARLRVGLSEQGYEELPVLGPHALAVSGLPARHGDPFDRMLVAQARAEGLTLLTADRALAAYGPPVHVV